jgi:hypothetical protein
MSINEALMAILYDHVEMPPEQRQELHDALIEREEAIKASLMVSGINHGAMPALTAHEIMHTGLGRPVTPEEKEVIEANYATAMHELAEIIRRMQQ